MGFFSSSKPSSGKDLSFGRFLGPLHPDERTLEQDASVTTTRRRVFVDGAGKGTGKGAEVTMCEWPCSWPGGRLAAAPPCEERPDADAVARTRCCRRHPSSSLPSRALPPPAAEDLSEKRDYIFYKTWLKAADGVAAARPGEGKDVCIVHGAFCNRLAGSRRPDPFDLS